MQTALLARIATTCYKAVAGESEKNKLYMHISFGTIHRFSRFFSIIQPNGKSLVCAPLPLETFVCWLILNEHKCLIMRRWFNWYLKLFYCHSSSELISNELRKCTHKSGAQTFHMKIYNILICLSPAHTQATAFSRLFTLCRSPARAMFLFQIGS